MGIIEMISALLQILLQFYKLKNQSLFFDITESFETTLHRLSEKREKLRKITDSKSQQEADDVMDEILETQKRKKLFLDDWKTQHK